ncbi:MAG: FecR family protein [Dongiaceae bacterium]
MAYAPFSKYAQMTRRDLHRLLAGAAGLGVTSLLASPSSAASRTQLGTVDMIVPVAGATFGTTTRLLKIADRVYRNDQLWTKDRGQLHIAMLDGSSLSIGERAEVTLDDSVVSPASATSGFLRVLRGAFRFRSPGTEKPSQPPQIDTPFAVLSLRGTEVFGGPIDGAYGILVISGEVEVTNEGGSVILKPGDGTTLTARNVAPTPPKQWPEAKVKRAKAMLRF